MATQVQIYNIALRSIGAAQLTATTDDVESARILNDIYEHIRDEVLAAHPWNFAIIYSASLTIDTAAEPEFGYDYAYDLPSDCLRVIKMSVDEPFKKVGQHLYTDESEVYIEYISQVSTTTLFSPLFVTTLAARLAAEVAYPLSNSTDLAGAKYNEYLNKLKLARSVDAQEGTFEKDEETSWIDDRE